MEPFGNPKLAIEVAVAQFVPQPAGDSREVPVPFVLPATLFCDGFQHLRGGAPALLRGLAHVAGGEFALGLCQQVEAGVSVLLSCHANMVWRWARQRQTGVVRLRTGRPTDRTTFDPHP